MKRPAKWTIDSILDATGGSLLYGNTKAGFSGISIDSRKIRPDELFVAIVGETHDGHKYTPDVVSAGIKGVMANRDKTDNFPNDLWEKEGISCIAVSDTTRALGDISSRHRERSGIPVVAITGSNGKTTTRKMTSSVVRRKYRTLSTIGNFNNDIGLPLSLMTLDKEHELAVLELGMNHAGEISRLAEICRPDIGVITNVGPAHIEFFDSLDAIAEAKGELIEKVADDGTMILNGDDPLVSRLGEKTDRKVLYFGTGAKAAVRAENIEDTQSGAAFDLVLPCGWTRVKLGVHGRVMVFNALAAAAVGFLMQVGAADIKAGLQAFEPAKGRMSVFGTKKEITVIDDTYNANPDSTKAAIDSLVKLKKERRGIFVAGDMLELGDRSEALHEEIGEKAAATGIDAVFAVGNYAGAVLRGAGRIGNRDLLCVEGTKAEIIDALKQTLVTGDWVLIKGSRGVAMETVVDAVRKWADN